MKMTASVLIVIFAVMMISATPNGSLSLDDRAIWNERAVAPSHVPEQENYIHIGGGYFSVFDCQKGFVEDQVGSVNDPGKIVFRLERLEWESRFVYLPEGHLECSLPDGRMLTAEMERLDYVENPGTGCPLYRLTAIAPEGRIVLLADAPGSDTERYPVLQGKLLLLAEDRSIITNFSIGGREEYAAERHLNRVIFNVSDFSSNDLSLSRYQSSVDKDHRINQAVTRQKLPFPR